MKNLQSKYDNFIFTFLKVLLGIFYKNMKLYLTLKTYMKLIIVWISNFLSNVWWKNWFVFIRNILENILDKKEQHFILDRKFFKVFTEA